MTEAPEHGSPARGIIMGLLIAAAPDMLAALEEIEAPVSASLVGNPFQEIERLRTIARAAIAAAKGDQE